MAKWENAHGCMLRAVNAGTAQEKIMYNYTIRLRSNIFEVMLLFIPISEAIASDIYYYYKIE